MGLPRSVTFEQRGAVGIVTIDRPAKRNALDTATVEAIGELITRPAPGVNAIVLAATGEHFSAGLDLGELRETSTFEGVLHSRVWHAIFDRIELGTVPVVSVLKGAVIGGGFELAATTHLRVAERSAFYALPEGSRGLFVGGGGSVRIPRLVGAHRMADLMLTGRVLDAEEAHRIGVSHYLVEPGDGLTKALALAERVAENAPVTNYAVLQALPRIQSMAPSDGFFVESLIAAISQGSEETKARLAAFLAGRAAKVQAPGATAPAIDKEEAT